MRLKTIWSSRRGSSAAFALLAVVALTCAPAAAQSRIAFTCGPDLGVTSSTHICLMDQDLSNFKGLGVAGFQPRWSPDGTRIAFNYLPGYVAVMNADGTNVVPLNAVALGPVSWLPDGSKIGFTGGAVPQVFVIGTSPGSVATQLTHDPSGANSPVWSPDGTEMLYTTVSTHLLTLSNSDGSNPRRIGPCTDPQNIACLVFFPAWSPDGKQIAFNPFSGGTPPVPFYIGQVSVMNRDGSNVSNVRQLTNVPFPSGAVGPRWSPDGAHIAFSYGNSFTGETAIGIIGAGGGDIQLIHPPSPYVSGPDWQPPTAPIILIPGFGGSKIICAGTVFGTSELWPKIPLPDFADMQLAADGISPMPQPFGCNSVQVGAILDTEAGVDVYKPAIDFLQTIAPGRNYTFPWDWRTSPAVSLTALDRFVDNVRSMNHVAKVVLMAHSMGGLLARWYIDDRTHADKVARLLTLGTPYWGSPKSLWPLLLGKESPDMTRVNFLLTIASGFQEWAKNASGLYFLYPSDNYGAWLTATLRSASPLDRAGLLDFVGNGLGGNARLLEQALDDHVLLDGFRTNGVKYSVVVGTGLNTLDSILIDPPPTVFSSLFPSPVEMTYGTGDGTVPARSGVQGTPGTTDPLGEDVPIFYACRVNHADLAGDPQVTDAVKGFLLTGSNIQGLSTICDTSGFEMALLPLQINGPPVAAPGESTAPEAQAAAAAVTSSAPLSLQDARLAGLIDVLELPKQTTIVTDTSKPVDFALPAGSFLLRVTPLRSGTRGVPLFYGPLIGTVSISASDILAVFLNGVPVQPGTQDTIPPTTTGALSPAPSAGWNNGNVTATLSAADNTGGSGVRRITYSASGAQTVSPTTVNGASASFAITASGVTTVSFFAEDNAGNIEMAKSLTVRIDRTPPAIACDAASGLWSAANVTIHCTAIDAGGSGLAGAADASFSLVTTVPDGSETANALTGSRNVCDVAGNCASAGPIDGNMVDRKPPVITIVTPAAAVYMLKQVVAASYSCSDGGSGVSKCTGTLATGVNLDMGSVGTKTFAVTAADAAGNSTTQTVTYSVAFNVCLQYDPTQASPAGAVDPIRVKLCDANNGDAGSATTIVTATSVSPSGALQSPGGNNPGGVFSFLNAGGYQFLLSTSGYAPGSYMLNFIATGDPTTHQAPFRLK